MKTIGFIVPYFTCGQGLLHPMTQLWLDSCKKNNTVDWLFFTDCDVSSFDVPSNVRIYKTTFADVKKRIQRIFDFEVCLNTPYKLCDYKPTYGEAFAEELRDYDFWGFCDIDLIWGNIRKFITDEILEKYDRVLTRGHCSLFRNEPEVNGEYRTLDSKGCMDYKTVFSTDRLWAFDEWASHNGGGYAEIEKRNGVPIYDAPIFADIQINRYSLHTTLESPEVRSPKIQNTVFHIYNDDVESLSVVAGKLLRKSYMYVHFQQRKLLTSSIVDNTDYYIVPPNRAINIKDGIDSINGLKKVTKGNVFSWNVKGQIKRFVYLFYKRLNS